MAIREHFRVDALVRVAAELRPVDVEHAEIERLLDLGAAGGCRGDTAPPAMPPARPRKPEAAKPASGAAANAATGPPAPAAGSRAALAAMPAEAAADVPGYFIDSFRIPVFLLPIYQAAGIQYGVRWEILAAINEIETDYGRNVAVSSKGAVGWMQFLPSTWKRYGVDANNDGVKDPYNPVDAIFAAARYLRAAGR